MARALRGGKMDRRITLLKFGLAADGYGDDAPSYTALPPIAASKDPAPGIERLQDAEVAATAPTIFGIRWTSALDPESPTGLNPKDRLQYPAGTGRIFDIVSANEIGRRQGIEIVAVARVDK